MIELRELTPDDWPVWRELRLAALRDAPSAFGSRYADWAEAGEDRWRDRLSMPRSRQLVAELDGVPVGMVSGVPAEAAGARELVSLWVAPAGRGRGVGDRLVEAVEHWARADGADALELAVAHGNDPATALYRRHGFTGTDRTGELMPDGIRREAVLRKALRDAR